MASQETIESFLDLNNETNTAAGEPASDTILGAGGQGSIPGSVKLDRVVNGSPELQRCFGAVMPRCYVAEIGPATRYTLRCNIASIMKI